MINQFVGHLGTEFALTAEEIADIFWLTHIRQQSAEILPHREVPSSGFSRTLGQDHSNLAKENEPAQSSDSDPPIGEEEPKEAPPDDQIGLTPKQTSDIRSTLNEEERPSDFHKVKLPDTPSLRDPLSLMLALRPLMQSVDARNRHLLDEKATVQKIAEEQIWMPVTKPGQESFWELALVVDESSSMLMWRHTVLEVQRLLRYHGAFRDVRTWGLVWDDTQKEMAIRPRFGVAVSHLSMRRPQELLDPNGRRLIVVVTDCVSQDWQTGRIVTTLSTWAKAGSMAILQMLPERMWPRTALRKAAAVELLGSIPGMANQKLRVFRQTIRGTVEERSKAVKVPVFSLESDLMALWSQMVAGRGSGSAVGYLWDISFTDDDSSPITSKSLSPIASQQRLKDFLRSSTPLAKRLARLLAASPVITLPVIRLIQETMLKESNQVHVAEVLLGGLFEPTPLPELGVNPEAVRYCFIDETLRNLLLEEASRVDTVAVLSRYIGRMLGKTLSQFMANWQNLSQQADQAKAEKEQPFAVIAAHLLKRQGRQYTEFVRQVEAHYGIEILPEQRPRMLFPEFSGEVLWQHIAAAFKPKRSIPPRQARDIAFRIDTHQGQLSCLHTGYTITQKQGQHLKPLEQGINTERLWPHSKGGDSLVQGDLHITFPTRVQVNSARGNAPFCELAASDVHAWFRNEEHLSDPPKDQALWGEYSKVGNRGIEPRRIRGFEPRDVAKGVVARAMLYIYAIYQDQLQQSYFEQQQAILLKWHHQFPPAAQERLRSRRIAESAQGNENPFVIDPTLAERIFGRRQEEPTEPPVESRIDPPPLSIPITPSLNLQQFYDACDPTQPLQDKGYYIDFSPVRGGDIVQELERRITRLARNRPTTQLITGHMGCGKSTELFRLKDALVRRNYEVVYFESDRYLEMADVEISDILFSIAYNISEHLDKIGIATRPTYLRGLFLNLADTLRTPMEISDVSFSAGLASITASAKQSPDMRSQLRQYLEPRTKSIITAINDELLTPANDRLQQQGKNRLVVIMDNLNRIDSALRSQGRLQSEYIFVDRGEQLRQLDCHMVYTIPLELMFSNDLVRLSNRFGTNPMVLPMVPVRDRSGNSDEAGIALLRQMVLIRAFPDLNVNQRIEAVGEVFDEMATLDRLCQVSGGHMRNLLRLLDGCLRKQDPPFLHDTLEAVIRNERDSLMGLVSEQEWDLLLQAVSRQDVQGDEDYNILVRSLFLYEYRDAQGRWFGLNPLLVETDRYRSWMAQQPRL